MEKKPHFHLHRSKWMMNLEWSAQRGGKVSNQLLCSAQTLGYLLSVCMAKLQSAATEYRPVVVLLLLLWELYSEMAPCVLFAAGVGEQVFRCHLTTNHTTQKHIHTNCFSGQSRVVNMPLYGKVSEIVNSTHIKYVYPKWFVTTKCNCWSSTKWQSGVRESCIFKWNKLKVEDKSLCLI